MGKNDRPQTFGELINDVQKSPDPFGAPPATDFANPFAMSLPRGQRLIDTSKEGPRVEPSVTYEHHTEVFNLCNKDERAEHDALQETISNSAGYYLVTKERSWTKEGDCMCLIEYVIAKSSKKAAEARRKADISGDDED